jgi:hypothetical protein
MRRRKLLVALVGLAVLVAVGAFMLWPRRNRVTRENYYRIRLRMSRAQVEAILGPPGDYTTVPVGQVRTNMSPSDATALTRALMDPRATKSSWMADTGFIEVMYSPEGVSYRNFGVVDAAQLSPLDRLLWQAKRLWPKWFP